MPFSNYSPLIDPNVPAFVQNLYAGQIPDFVFQAENPKNSNQRNKSIINLVITFAIWGTIITSLYPVFQQYSPQLGEKLSNVTELVKKEYAQDSEGVAGGLLLGGGIIFIIIIGIIKGIVTNIIQIFTQEKIWYFATFNGLTIIQKRRSQQYGWDNFDNDLLIENTPFGDKLTLKRKGTTVFQKPEQSPNTGSSSINPLIQNLANFMINTAKGDKDITILNPPNIMEVKRLCEKRIKEQNG